MATDDLNAPLGQSKPKKRSFQLPKAGQNLAIGFLALPILIFVGWTIADDNPFGGEPMATAAADLRVQSAAKKTDDAAPRAAVSTPDAPENVPPAPAPGTKTVTIIDGSSGKRQNVVVPDTDEKSAGPEDRLSERSRHGLLPKIAPDGVRPSEAYSSPVKPLPGKPNAPQVAIVVSGLGIGAASTNDALRKLPAAVTFSFAPYGNDLERQVGRARADGHEILLQVPMEPFDYPENDPGPHTLLTTLEAGQNVDRLHWLMSRFQGYVGLINFMGARFMSSEQALAPVLREAAKRGLIYVDDSTSVRSLANQVAGANSLAFVKADVVLDVTPTAADVDRALSRLEAHALDRGLAVGFAGALPISVERIARWVKSAESRGILVVPITGAVARAKSS